MMCVKADGETYFCATRLGLVDVVWEQLSLVISPHLNFTFIEEMFWIVECGEQCEKYMQSLQTIYIS